MAHGIDARAHEETGARGAKHEDALPGAADALKVVRHVERQHHRFLEQPLRFLSPLPPLFAPHPSQQTRSGRQVARKPGQGSREQGKARFWGTCRPAMDWKETLGLVDMMSRSR